MSDRERAIVTVIGGALALLIAVLSSLAIGPGPIFTFDKVVVGALLVGGLGAFGVAINIGQSPAAKAERAFAGKAMTPVPQYSDLDRLLERVKQIERELPNAKDAKASAPRPFGPGGPTSGVEEKVLVTGAKPIAKPVAENDPGF